VLGDRGGEGRSEKRSASEATKKQDLAPAHTRHATETTRLIFCSQLYLLLLPATCDLCSGRLLPRADAATTTALSLPTSNKAADKPAPGILPQQGPARARELWLWHRFSRRPQQAAAISICARCGMTVRCSTIELPSCFVVSACSRIPVIQNEPIVDPKQRTTAAATATACAKGSRQPVDRPICSTWRHTKFPERSRLAHTVESHRPVLSSGDAKRQWVVYGQGCT
jgi:hypothetical protein